MTRTFHVAEDKAKNTFVTGSWGHTTAFPLAFDCVIYPRISTPGQRGNVSSELQLAEDGELWNMALRCGWQQHQVRHPKDDMELSGDTADGRPASV